MTYRWWDYVTSMISTNRSRTRRWLRTLRPLMVPFLALAIAYPVVALDSASLPDPASFEQRCAGRGVVLCDPLDDGRVTGEHVTDRTPNATLPQALKGKYGDWRWCLTPTRTGNPRAPSIDRDIKASGTGSLRFTIPSQSGPADSGYCEMDFSPDNSVQFGEGDTFFVQFRVRFSCELLFVDCDSNSPGYKRQRRRYWVVGVPHGAAQGGFKVSVIGEGDNSRLRSPTDSCTLLELVVVNLRQLGIVGGYHSCGWYAGHTEYYGLNRRSGAGQYDVQPKGGRGKDSLGPHCWNVDPTDGRPVDRAWDECVLWYADEWITVTQQVTVGHWTSNVNDATRSSNYRLWVAREGKPAVLVMDHDLNLRRPEAPFIKYGKIWLLPYATGKDAAETHPDAYMWFDELIVSKDPIPQAR